MSDGGIQSRYVISAIYQAERTPEHCSSPYNITTVMFIERHQAVVRQLFYIQNLHRIVFQLHNSIALGGDQLLIVMAVLVWGNSTVVL